MTHSKFSAESLARPHVPGLEAYTPGVQPTEKGWVKLNTNENPYAPSPVVEDAILQEAEGGTALRLYPDPRSTPLREALGAYHGLSAENICVGNGSDDILSLLVRVFGGEARPVGFTVPSYSLYPVLVAIENGEVVTHEFDRSMDLDVERLAALPANLLFLTSPNAPTGVGFSTARIARLAEGFSGLLIVDEAYADFADENAAGLVRDYPNLVVTRSFSKSYSLAGLRVGYAIAAESVIALLDRVRDSYNVNRLSQAAALAALEDRGYFQAVVDKVKRTRDYYEKEFRKREWFTYESQANFLFTEPRDPDGRTGADIARSLFEHLYRNRVLVRYFPTHALTRGFLRISVGSEQDMLALMEHIETWPGIE